ncbi:DUF2853 family protein [Leucothrix pacifica]|uniref:DUF2853 domain-containing protein n=1 Tax=Leucothrix pacifica TaxID=1247513 RepID=A0A317C152_9GAMM|nr:DUF2853 family protein [Leucothrix pacifica]PWQ92374.1 hypothetical protein DKW60_21395 [Leucothrix pacifica]
MADVIQVIEDVKKYDANVDEQLVTSIFRSLGPVVYNRDTRYVACSDPYELEMIRDGFLSRQLNIKLSKKELDDVLQETCQQMADSHMKLRVTFYYLLVTRFNKQSHF